MRRGSRGQSELIGVILLIGIVVILTFTVGGVLLANASSQAAADPLLNTGGNATSQYVTLRHTGGESLDVSGLTVILRGETTERYAFETFTQRRGDDTSQFEPGDEWRRTHGVAGDEMEILLVDGRSNSIVDSITVDITATIAARFSTSPRYPGENEPITFDASDSEVSGATLSSYSWDFGDGDTATGDDVDHAYAEDGTYDVTLTVEATDGRTATRTKEVTVYNDAPAARFTYSPTTPEAGEVVSFDGTNSSDPDGSITSYDWDFGDGATATGATPSHTYSATGEYTVSLTVTDDDGTERTTNEAITVATSAPTVTTLAVEGAPINYTEAGTSGRNVTIVYSEQMDQSVAPTASVRNVSTTGPPAGSRWLNGTAYLQKINIEQNTEDVTATVNVSGAQDTDGFTQTPASKEFLVDTERPGDVNDIVGKPDINASNQTAVTYAVKNPDSVAGDEDIRVTLTDASGATVSNRTALQGGASDITDVTIDASALSDGTVDVTAVAIDDVNNTGATAGPDQVTKDTQPPAVSNYTVSSSGEEQFTVSFDATETTTAITDVSIAADGPGVVDAKINSNNVTNGDTTSYEITYSVTQNGEYEVSLVSVRDRLGNDGASGQSQNVTTGTVPAIASASLGADNSYVGVTFSEGVYTDGDGTGAVTANDFDLTFTRNGGDVTDVTVVSVTRTDGTAPSGGETTLRVQLDVTDGPARGVEEIEIQPVDGSSIYDSDGFALPASETTGALTLNDRKSPTVSVSAPDGGESLAGGSNYTVTWTASDDGVGIDFDSVDIAYSTDNGTSYTTIVSGTTDDGADTWRVPNVDTSDALVRVRVDDDNGNTGTDTSNATFTIDSTPPAVTVTDPNGGEVIEGGSTVAVEWTASDSRTGIRPNAIDVAYSTDGGTSYSDIVTDTANDGIYNWTVPTVDETDVLVRVTATDGAGNDGSDASDGPFTIDSTAPSVDTFSDVNAFSGNDTVVVGNLSVSDVPSGLTAVNVTVRDPNGNLIGSENATGLGGAGSFSRTDLSIATSGIQPNKQYTVSVFATDRVGKLTTNATTVTSPSPGQGGGTGGGNGNGTGGGSGNNGGSGNSGNPPGRN